MSVTSIDLWGTLIKANPTFLSAKIKLTKNYFGLSCDDKFIIDCFEQTKKQLNDIVEITGWQPSEQQMFQLLLSKFYTINIEEWWGYAVAYKELAKSHLPIVYSEQTIPVLKELSKNNILSVSSNTMFIGGDSLKEALENLGIHNLFREMYFSDEMGQSKPSGIMFNHSHFHIGDNVLTDGKHSNPIIINSNNLTISDAYNIINKK